MATLRLYQWFDVTINGVMYSGGSRSTPQEITVSNPLLDMTKSLAAGATWTPWGGQTPDAVSAFSFLFILSDTTGVQLELMVDRDATYGTRSFCLSLQANKPLILPADDAYANYTTNFAAGTLDVIDKLLLKNPSAATQTATVRVALFN